MEDKKKHCLDLLFGGEKIFTTETVSRESLLPW